MKRTALLVLVLAVFAAPGIALAAGHGFTAELTTEAEVPEITAPSDGSGSAMATINEDGSIDYEVTYQDLTGAPVAAHIHFGGADVAGPVILPLAHGPSPFSGTLTEADFVPAEGGPQTYEEALDAIRDGMTYVNVHTEMNGGGEIRGQLLALPPTDAGASSTGLPMGIALLAVGAVALMFGYRRLSVRPI
ncbi:CHRD domain-containing protein [soil metagenome]